MTFTDAARSHLHDARRQGGQMLATARTGLADGRRRLDALADRYGPADTLATARQVAHGLGWFSIALGVAELLAPRRIGRMLGLRREAPIIQAYGAREIATGVAILAGDDPRPWIWARVGGDLIDLATLAVGARRPTADRTATGVAFASVLTVTAIDLACAIALSRAGRDGAWKRW